MLKKKEPEAGDRSTINMAEKTERKAKGFMQKASDFIARHLRQGERLLEKERLEQEYELDDYMEQYSGSFDSVSDFRLAKNNVMDALIEEYLAENPNKDKFTFKADYLEYRVDRLMADEIEHAKKEKRLKDIFEVTEEEKKKK